MNLDINVVHMSMDGYVISEHDVAHLAFGPSEHFICAGSYQWEANLSDAS